MLLNSVIIVLREVLEAALLLSILVATSRILRFNYRWLVVAIVLGILGAVVYGYYLEAVSDLLDGFGQEILNALIQVFVAFVLAAVVFLIGCRRVNPCSNEFALPWLMAVAVALAITREGLDIIVYVSGFWHSGNLYSAVNIGSFVGACIGFSVGVLFYYLLLAQPSRRSIPVSVVLLVLIAASMNSQAVRFLIQADWVTVTGALWNTSGILSEGSLLGQLLYALIGYEAAPSGIEISVYVITLVLMTAVYGLGRNMSAGQKHEH